ncbi:NAD(P)-binding protein [Mycena maculata]|uniref:NAD(P)-binding protein n=1 Tax=Mycena maculata TaxID=230809 RepID=A0AAD7NUQ6_9AGAR|nr:NAD(P)-binding protein [Mycena maculata]
MPRRKSVSEDELVDLHGKRGHSAFGSTGIGYATIQMLARRGAKVYMGARNVERAAVAIKQLESENILVNNAAMQPEGPFKFDKNGLLDIMVTNHFSHFVLTDTLLPPLKETANESGQFLTLLKLSSSAHMHPKPTTFSTKEAINKNYGESTGAYLSTYGNSKLANILHMKELQKRLNTESVPITCIAVHPGRIATEGTTRFVSSIPYVGWLLNKFLKQMVFSAPWRHGAMTVAFAAAGKEVAAQREQYQGAYLVPIAATATPSSFSRDERLQKELYETTEKIMSELF